MPRQHEMTHPGRRGEQRSREADRTLTEGFRPLGLPAVAAAAKVAGGRRDGGHRDTASNGDGKTPRDS